MRLLIVSFVLLLAAGCGPAKPTPQRPRERVPGWVPNPNQHLSVKAWGLFKPPTTWARAQQAGPLCMKAMGRRKKEPTRALFLCMTLVVPATAVAAGRFDLGLAAIKAVCDQMPEVEARVAFSKRVHKEAARLIKLRFGKPLDAKAAAMFTTKMKALCRL